VSLLRRARYSLVIASSQLGSLSTAHEEGTGEYLLTEAGKLSRSQGGTCMPEVLCMRCTSKGTSQGACTSEGGGEGASEDGGEGAGEDGGEGASEGGAVGVCGAIGRTMIEGMSSRNS
jgi:hypothetical protein